MKIKILLFLFLIFSFLNISYWNDITNKIEEYEIQNVKRVFVWDEYKIDLTSLREEINKDFPDSNILFEWTWEDKIIKSSVYQKEYFIVWNKTVSLNIYELTWENTREVLYSKDFSFLVYDKVIPLIISSDIWELVLNDFIESYKPYWTYIDVIWNLSNADLELYTILPSYSKYNLQKWEHADYLMIWWDKDFVINIISKLNREISLSSTDVAPKDFWFKFYVLSTFNINVMSSYIDNFIWDKEWLSKMLITSEQSRYKVIENSISIDEIQNSLQNRWFEYIDVKLTESKLSAFKFISTFVSNLSNKWYDVDSIYIVLIIPIILTLISFFKHFIWISTTWILVPLFLVILWIKIWFLLTTVVFILLTSVNLILSKIVSTYTLLYTPKASFLIIFNLFIFIIGFNLLEMSNFSNLTVTDSIYIVLFLIISERLITLISSKEFWEYRWSLINTFVFFVIWYLLLSFWEIKVLILAYPELLIILLPLNFVIWRFTGLRVTEYFRFREIIKSIEE